jgi:hypothetical protein
VKRLLRKRKMPKLGGETVLKIAFEYGLVFSEVAREQKIEITKELSERMEKIFLSELKEKGFERVALDIIPNILACFETK